MGRKQRLTNVLKDMLILKYKEMRRKFLKQIIGKLNSIYEKLLKSDLDWAKRTKKDL